jgi:eukaryotic-like serine/threonine-protein kinase
VGSRGRVFLSCVTAEFKPLRDNLALALRRADYDVKVQEDFFQSAGTTMAKIDDYIRSCRVVVHLIGKLPGAVADPPDLDYCRAEMPELGYSDSGFTGRSYTQLEAYLALHHHTPLLAYALGGEILSDEQERHSQHLKAFYRYADAFTDEAALLRKVLADLMKIAPPIEDEALTLLAERVRANWITQYRTDSIHGAVMLDLAIEPDPTAVTRANTLPLGKLGTTARSAFEAASKFLLILGAPGSGKTITLLQLTGRLLDEARGTTGAPVPVVLHLVSYDPSRALEDWIGEEISHRYGSTRELAGKWLRQRCLLPMLDGLDEVPSDRREACVRQLNDYLQSGAAPGMVVTCRTDDYRLLAQHERLRLEGALVLQPLDQARIDHFLAGDSGQLRRALKDDLVLSQLGTSPLMLDVIVLAGADAHPSGSAAEGDPGRTPEQARSLIFTRYLERALEPRPLEPTPWPRAATARWLSVLARQLHADNQAELRLECLQPSWLPQGRLRVASWIISRLAACLLAGGALSLAAVITGFEVARFWWLHLLIPLAAGASVCAIDGRRYFAGGAGPAQAAGAIPWSAIARATALVMAVQIALSLWTWDPQAPLGAFHYWIWVKTCVQSSWLGDVAGAALGLVLTSLPLGFALGWRSQRTVSDEVRTAERLAVSGGRLLKAVLAGVALTAAYWALFRDRGLPARARGGICQAHGIQNALERLVLHDPRPFGLILLVAATLVGLALSLTARPVDTKTRLNEGLWLSLRNSLLTGVAAGLVLGAGTAGIISQLPNHGRLPLRFGIAVATVVITIQFVTYAGMDLLSHYLVRFLLWRCGRAPASYVRFLEYAERATVLRRVGGGFRFMHNLIRDHLAKRAP